MLGYEVSKFVSKYFYKVLTSVKAYKAGNIEQALVDCFLLIDDILTLPNVNKILKSFDDLIDQEAQLEYDFLSLELVNTDKNRFFQPISIFYEQYINHFLSRESKKSQDNNLTSSPESETTAFTPHNMDGVNSYKNIELKKLSSSLVENEIDLNNESCFNCTDVFPPEQNEDIYTFGGIIVQQPFYKSPDIVSFAVGCTANVAIIKNKVCYIANIGDSMAVVYKNQKAIRLNLEHKLNLIKERKRICNSGTPIYNERIGGRLNLTRAFGKIIQ
jgi:hypothetical protein